MTKRKKQPDPLDALDVIDDVNELFLGISKKRIKRKKILDGDLL